MLLHHGPYELPVATLHVRRPDVSSLTGDLLRWMLTRWAWLRPRAIPVAVAFAAMLGILAATNYLTELAHAEQLPAHATTVVEVSQAPAPVVHVLEFSR